MVGKTQHKTLWRLFRKHITRFLTIIAIVLVSVGFMAGIGEVENEIKVATNQFYQSQNVSDLIIKSSSPQGFTAEEIALVSDRYGSDHLFPVLSYEMKENDEIHRHYYGDMRQTHINKVEILEGRLPEASNEVLVERATNDLKTMQLHERFTYRESEYEVVGIVLHPLFLNKNEEPSWVYPDEHLRQVIYFHTPALAIVNDLYVALANREIFEAFSDEYETLIAQEQQWVETNLPEASLLTLYENFGLYSLVSYAEKVGIIALIFVLFFLLITLLVVYSTMSRLFDEERSQIACQKTLGYRDETTLGKYLFFVTAADLLGGGLAFAVGIGLTKIIYAAFHLQYAMPPFPRVENYLYYLITFVVLIIATLLLTYLTGKQAIAHKPVVLLSPKTPKAGKKVILERIPFLWKRLSFKYKSTFRNVLLYQSRFWMTVLSILGSTVLVLAGMGLMDCSVKMENGMSLISISAALIIFSALLCALVIYNITNINISERHREIATLMVLGYRDREVVGYIYREIYIMSAIGALLGLPLGVGFLQLVFYLIDFGTLGDIRWWTWLGAPLITMFFSFLATRLLHRKIIRTDMNASLKTWE